MAGNDYDEEVDANRWMISYADFITLLFAFFVVMYAISSVNEGKYRILSASINQAFDVEARALQQISLGDPAQAASPHIVDIPDTVGFADPEPGDTQVQDPDPADDPAQQLAGFIDERLGQVRQGNEWIEINLNANQLFSAGTAELGADARAQLAATADFLAGFDEPITIEGYTDNVPINGRFPSNWELSAARASAVARYFEARGVAAERLAAIGYGENFPVQTNATPAGRSANRRVVVMVARRGNAAQVPNPRERQRAFAYVRRGSDQSQPAVAPVRTETGGLLFTNTPDSPAL
jgi:chemotaxis protein MotB